MKNALQYVSDINGNTQSVQLPLSEWEKIQTKIRKYEQALKLKSDLKEALAEVIMLKNTKEQKQTLNDFLNEL